MNQGCIIAGAGPAGVATALALLKQGVQPVYLLQKEQQQPFHIGETLAPSARTLLKQLGLFDSFEQLSLRTCLGTLARWGAQAPQFNDYLRYGMGNGWHINRFEFNQFLKQSAVQAGAQLHYIQHIHSLTWSGSQWHLHATDEKGNALKLQANFAVDATGRAAALAPFFEVEKMHLDKLLALAVHLPGSALSTFKTPNHSMVSTSENGWWYAATLPQDTCILSYQVDKNVAKLQRLRTPQNWLAQYQAQTDLLPSIIEPERIERIHAFAANTQRLTQFAGHHWLAVGDAALSMDPLSSSGIISALSDGIEAAKAIYHAMETVNSAMPQNFDNYQTRLQSSYEKYTKTRESFYSQAFG
ncbi:tryptophan 7-halogenase [Paraneptunicella aestuarii]|uniref:NAD(P)/FAD-dependent oxidoreductase n=1 Tax=Paraneptunicella aestuarii TaxID=2831148 RepID=UPI001E390CC5|nr:FAD-dependent monooxygenase [Paraneptunicella aestuarii]UAA39199.1 tryptophan 7-halogenase [Paraneptunicella aestuarii]